MKLGNAPSRKKLMKYIKELEAYALKQQKFIDEECTTKGEVLRMYATMRVTIVDSLGKGAADTVIAHLKELTAPEAYQYKAEAEEIFGGDLESPAPPETEIKKDG